MKSMFSNSRRDGIIAAVLTSLAGLLLWGSPLGDGLVRRSYDLLYRFRDDLATEGATILYMDPASDFALEMTGKKSWDRDIHARLLERLREYRPKAVVFDIAFPYPIDPASDQRLADAAKALGNVVTAAISVESRDANSNLLPRVLSPPFPALRDAVQYGIPEVPDPDRHIREHNHHETSLHNVPSLAWRAAQLTLTNDLPEANAPRSINYYGPPGSIRHYSYHKIFESNSIPAAHLSNQVVFIGDRYDFGWSGGERSDTYGHPYAWRTDGQLPGVEAIATAYLNLVRGDWLRRLPRSQEAALILVLGCLLGFGLARCRWELAIGLGALVALLLAGIAVWSAWSTLVWFPWLIPVAVQVPTAILASVVIAMLHLAIERRALEQALILTGQGNWPKRGHPDATAPLPAGGPTSDPESTLPSTPNPASAAAGQDQFTIPDHVLLRRIGKGAYGHVWLARDAIETYKAVKIVHRATFVDSAPLEREFNGIRRFAPISRSHPGFVQILHVGRHEATGSIYYVMEPGDDATTAQKIDPDRYVPLTLDGMLEQRGRLPLLECLDICIRLADAIEYLHRQQLIHRDIKPSNIVFVGGQPKLADIGLVTDVSENRQDMSLVGTPGRIAPEGPGAPPADVFSLGKLIYETAFGLRINRFPELPTDVVEGPEDSPLLDLNGIILHACEKEVKRRYASAAALREDLRRLQARVAASSPPRDPANPGRRAGVPT